MNKKGRKHALAHTDSEIIADLKRAIEGLESRRKRPEELEGIIAEAKALARWWKDPESAKRVQDRRPLFGETASDKTYLLAALVLKLLPDHEIVELIRRHFPNELEKLRDRSLWAGIFAATRADAGRRPKLSRRQRYERDKRAKRQRSFFNSIEYQFGGELAANLLKDVLFPDDPVHKSILSSMQNCLDDILEGQAVNMLKLEELFFGIGRHRLGKLISSEDKKDRRYGARVVANVMHALLKEKPQEKRKGSKPGRPSSPPWLNNDLRRACVLAGIGERITRIAAELWEMVISEKDAVRADSYEEKVRKWRKEIADPFLAVVRRHLPASGKK